MSRRLTIGMRCRIISEEAKNHSWAEYAGYDVLLKERSSHGGFSVMILGQKELKKKDPKTVINEVAWINEDEMEFVNTSFKANLDFMDWYEEHKDEFCGDCGVWFPDGGCIDPKTNEDYICPNENCPGRLYDQGLCPHCGLPAVNKGKTHDECPDCGFEFNM